MSKSPAKTITQISQRQFAHCRIACSLFLCLIFGYITNAEVSLSWQDNSDNEDGFKIERSVNGTAFEKIASVPADTTSFTDRSTDKGNLYLYRVRAFNEFGFSGYTNLARYETPAPISFDDWMSRVLFEGIHPSSSLALDTSLAEADLPNLLCYTHGINPFKPDRSLLAKARIVDIDGRPTRVIERALFKFSIGVKTRLLISSDLKTWRAIDYQSRIFEETDLHRWQQIILPAQNQAVHYKLEVTLPSPGSS